jgi:hypothetical protein
VLNSQEMVALRGEFPDKAATPQVHAQTLKVPGKPTCYASEIAGELKLDLEQLTKATEKERERRVVAGISITDELEVRTAYRNAIAPRRAC